MSEETVFLENTPIQNYRSLHNVVTPSHPLTPIRSTTTKLPFCNESLRQFGKYLEQCGKV